MAQKVQVLLEDDIDGSAADETVVFGFGGTEYEIDLTAEHAAALRGSLSPFVAAARKVRLTPTRSGDGKGTRPMDGRPRNNAERALRLAAIRVWAKAHGKHINERGRIPQAIVNEYDAAQRAPQAAVPATPATVPATPATTPAGPPEAATDAPGSKAARRPRASRAKVAGK